MENKIPHDIRLIGKTVDLRPPIENDCPGHQEFLSDPKTMTHLRYMAHIEQGGWTLEQVKERIEKHGARLKEQTGLDLTVLDKKSGKVAGVCGFNVVDFDHRNAEFGIIIHHPFWGGGLAAECHLLVLEFGFEALDLHRIQFRTSTKNLRMRGFFEKMGIELEAIHRQTYINEGKFLDDACYALFQPQWPETKERLQKKLLSQLNPS